MLSQLELTNQRQTVTVNRMETKIKCITGDFNQRIPRFRQPEKVYRPLTQIIELGLNVATAGIDDNEGHLLIDHVTTCGNLAAKIDEIIPKRTPKGSPLSDHVGIIATLKWTRG